MTHAEKRENQGKDEKDLWKGEWLSPSIFVCFNMQRLPWGCMDVTEDDGWGRDVKDKNEVIILKKSLKNFGDMFRDSKLTPSYSFHIIVQNLKLKFVHVTVVNAWRHPLSTVISQLWSLTILEGQDVIHLQVCNNNKQITVLSRVKFITKRLQRQWWNIFN